MNTLKIALAALVIVAGAGPVLAATTEDVDTGADVRECTFVAEQGGYVCSTLKIADSLVETGDGLQKKKLSIKPSFVPSFVPLLTP
jgi:hypothetical protein